MTHLSEKPLSFKKKKKINPLNSVRVSKKWGTPARGKSATRKGPYLLLVTSGLCGSSSQKLPFAGQLAGTCLRPWRSEDGDRKTLNLHTLSQKKKKKLNRLYTFVYRDLYNWFLEIGSYCIVLAGLELAMCISLSLKPLRFPFLCLPNSGVKGVGHLV